MEKKVEKIVDGINNVLINCAAIALFGILLSVTVQIVVRNFLPHIPCPWTEEVAKYLLIWMCFLGSPVALRKGEHLMVDLFFNMYPPAMRRWMKLLMTVMVAAFCVYLLYFGMELCLNPMTWKMKSPSAQIPRLWVYAALPVGAFFMLIVALWDIYAVSQMIRGKREDTTGASIVDEAVTLSDIDAMEREAANK